MATHSSVLAWRGWWAAVYGVAQSRTRLKQLGSSSSTSSSSSSSSSSTSSSSSNPVLLSVLVY